MKKEDTRKVKKKVEKKDVSKKETDKPVIKKEKKQKNESIPMNKFSKTVGIISGCGIIVFLILVVLSNLNVNIGNFIWLNIRNPIMGLLFKIFSFKPTIGITFPVFLTILTFICLAFILFFEIKKSIKYKKRVLYSNLCLGIMFINLFIMLLPTFLTMTEYGYGKINYKYFNNNVNSKYTKEDLIFLNKYYQEKILSLADNFERKNNEIVYDKDMLEVSTNNLLNISAKYTFLKGLYPTKVDYFSKKEHENNVDQTVGYTMGYGIKVDNEGNKVSLLHVLTHELCHTKGLVRESETEFCAYVAGINGDEFSKYAAYIDALGRVNYALYMIDKEKSFDLEEPVLNLCLNKEYSEICSYYSKEVNHYINDSYKMEIRTYRLRNYYDYFDEFFRILTDLKNEFNARFYIGKREDVSIEAIQAEIVSGSKEDLIIEIDIDEKKFNKLSSYLIDNDKYFVGIYQINDDTEEPDDRSEEEAFKHYLKPFNNKSDILLSFSEDFMDEYDYERMTRLLLEYHHDEIKGKLLVK